GGASQRGYRRHQDSRRSASTFPPVWHVGQYWREESANVTSRTRSPHGVPSQPRHGSPVRPCTRMPRRLASLSSAAGLPEASSTAVPSTSTTATCSLATCSSVKDG